MKARDFMMLIAGVALAILLLLGLRDPSDLSGLRARIHRLEQERESASTGSDLQARVSTLSSNVENAAIAVERLFESDAIATHGIAPPPTVRRYGTYRWRAGLEQAFRARAMQDWGSWSGDLDLNSRAMESLIQITVMAGVRREYLNQRVREGTLDEEQSGRKLEALDQWERQSTAKILRESGEEEE